MTKSEETITNSVLLLKKYSAKALYICSTRLRLNLARRLRRRAGVGGAFFHLLC